jgi:hypothetical protein
MENFTWIGNNRKYINEKAPKPSGGVGILIRNAMFNIYEVKIVDSDFDGILALLFENKETSHNFVSVLTSLQKILFGAEMLLGFTTTCYSLCTDLMM